MIGLQLPKLLSLAFGQGLLELQMGLPAGRPDAHGQGVEYHLETGLATLQVGIQRQVFEGHGLALGIGAIEAWGVEARHGALHRALGPGQP